MEKISAVEYLCLKYPFKQNFLKLIAISFQELYLNGIFEVKENYILINKKDKRKRLRFSYSSTHKINLYSPKNLSELFIINCLKSKPEIHQHDLKIYFTKQLGSKPGKRFKKI